MAAINFPNAPVAGDQVTLSGVRYVFNGTGWTTAASGISKHTASATPPASPVDGDTWWETDTSKMWMYASGTWIQISGEAVGGGIADAPSDTTVYGRKDAAWVRAVPLAGGTMTGILKLSGNPVAGVDAAPKQYVVPLAGGTMTGLLTLSGNPVGVLDATPKQYVDAAVAASYTDAMAYSGMQVNGGMMVVQRTAGLVDQSLNAGAVLVADEWRCWSSGSQNMKCGQVSGTNLALPGYVNGIRMYVQSGSNPAPGANDWCIFIHGIEGYRMASLAWGTSSAKNMTIGFWVHAVRPGMYSGAVRNGVINNRSYVFTFNVNVSNTWEWKTITIPGCPSGVWEIGSAPGMFINFTMMCGTGNTTTPGSWITSSKIAATGTVNGVAASTDIMRITGLIVLPGNAAPTAAQSSLIVRPFAEELDICLRYFEKSYFVEHAIGTLSVAGCITGFYEGSATPYPRIVQSIYFKRKKRASVTVTLYSASTGAAGKAVDAWSSVDVSASCMMQGQDSCVVSTTSATPNAAQIYFHYTADSRVE